MGHYPAFICEYGHVISSLSDSCADKYCSKCGKPIVKICANCAQPIRGRSREQYGFAGNYSAPAYCRFCGKPFPWTMASIEATVHMLEESPELTTDERNRLIEILPDTIAETPKTQLAASRFKRAMTNAGDFVADGLREFAVSFGCELFKNYLGLS